MVENASQITFHYQGHFVVVDYENCILTFAQCLVNNNNKYSYSLHYLLLRPKLVQLQYSLLSTKVGRLRGVYMRMA